jgi:uncharacterized protein (DUF983 family)
MQQKDVTPAPRSTGGSDVAFGAAKANQDDEVSVRGSSHCMPCRMRRTDVHGFSEETAYDRLPNGMIMPETACSNCALRASLSLVDDGDVYRVMQCAPEVELLDALVTELNATNNFSLFVQALRRSFVALAAAQVEEE